MNGLKSISPTCPRCENNNTYDVIPELTAIDTSSTKLSFLKTAYSFENKKYYCVNCNHSWKKYKGRRPYEKIKILQVETGGFPGPFFNVKINLESLKVKSNALVKYRFEEKNLSQTLSEQDVSWFLEELYKCDVMNWAERYEDLYVLGGSHWNLRIEYDTYAETKNGSNHFPPEWEKFCQLISKLIGKDFY